MESDDGRRQWLHGYIRPICIAILMSDMEWTINERHLHQIEQRVKDGTRLLYLLTFQQAGSNWS